MGALAALVSAAIWAFASTRYAQHSRAIGSARVNLTRASTVLPVFLVITAVLTGGKVFSGVDGGHALWLGLSVICAYAFADNIFFAAARRVGVTTAMAIASTYPLWATLAGAIWRHEHLGVAHAGGATLCVGGVIALILLAPRAAHDVAHAGERPAKSAKRRGAAVASRGEASDAEASRAGILLALVTSVLWAGNSVATKMGGTGLITVQANLIRFLFAWAILAVTSLIVPRPTRDQAEARHAYLALIPVSLLEAGLGSSLFVYGLSHTDLAVGSTLSSLAPLMSVPFALLYGEERWSLARFIAVMVTVGGVIALVSAS